MTSSSSSSPPQLHPPSEPDPLGGYIQSSLSVRHNYTLATYVFPPPCGLSQSRGVVFALHGVLGHTLFEWLSPNVDNHRILLENSLIHKLLQLNLVVIAHDHPGHGRSTGLHGYVQSHDHLRDCAIDVVDHFMQTPQLKNKPTFMIGMSMGGTTAIRISMQRPDLIHSYALFSPAVRPPDDMFGPYGHFLKAISPILGFLVPKLPVLKLPPSPDPVIRDAVEKDGLVHRGALRVQMGMEFLRVYEEIDRNADEITFKHVAIFIGGKDNIVSPSGIDQFVQRIQSKDKQCFKFDHLAHEVMREQGCEKAVEQFVDWVRQRIDTVA